MPDEPIAAEDDIVAKTEDFEGEIGIVAVEGVASFVAADLSPKCGSDEVSAAHIGPVRLWANKRAGLEGPFKGHCAGVAAVEHDSAGTGVLGEKAGCCLNAPGLWPRVIVKNQKQLVLGKGRAEVESLENDIFLKGKKLNCWKVSPHHRGGTIRRSIVYHNDLARAGPRLAEHLREGVPQRFAPIEREDDGGDEHGQGRGPMAMGRDPEILRGE